MKVQTKLDKKVSNNILTKAMKMDFSMVSELES